MPMVTSSPRSVVVCVSVVARILVWQAAAAGILPLAAQAQSPGPFFVTGRNVNTVGAAEPGANPEFRGDPLHLQKNEVACGVSPNNPLRILCANNDYRGQRSFGDAWIGVSMSDDGGLTWRSLLEPTFPRTPSGIGAADPVVATAPGIAVVGYITISRSDGRGQLRLARYLERNKENGDPYVFLDSGPIGKGGTPGRFNDKPAIELTLDTAGCGAGGGGCTTPIAGRLFPRAVVDFGYALFPGNENNAASEIYHVRSTDYGATWSNPAKLSESVGINQGIDFASDGQVLVAVWRRVKDVNEPDAMMVARYANGRWSRARVLALGRFFDQETSDVQFRTRSFPNVVHDGQAFHAFWSARGIATFPGAQDDARVVVASSPDGQTWTPPIAVDDFPGRGHQLMPVAAVGGGRIQVNWIDSRNNLDGSFGPFLADFVHDDPTSSTGRAVYRQSADIYAAQAAAAAGLPAFGPPQPMSRYRSGLFGGQRFQLERNFVNARLFRQGSVAFHGDYHAVASLGYVPNPARPGAWVRNVARSDSHAIFYSAFTDNRDIQGYVWAGPPSTAFTAAGSPTQTTSQGEPGVDPPAVCDPSAGSADADTRLWTPLDSPLTRAQSIYAAASLPGLIVFSPSASKPAGALQRAYVVFVQNLTPANRIYRLTIANQPPGDGGRAAWQRLDACTGTPPVCPPPLTVLEASIPRRSSLSRTVYITSAEQRPRVLVQVSEIGGDGYTGSVLLNANPDVGEIENPDGAQLPSIFDLEAYQPEILARQTTLYTTGLTNPEVVPASLGAEFPRIEYPRIEYPRIEYPRIEYPRIEYDPLGNPRIEYPRIEYPRIEYTAIENPRIEYSSLTGDDLDGGTTEITWPVTTGGANTTTSMTSKVFVNGGLPEGLKAQLLVTVPYATTVANSCDASDRITLIDNQVVVDTIVDPADLRATAAAPDVVNPPASQPSFFVKPGQTVYVTLRVWGAADARIAARAGLWVRSQPDVDDGDTTDEDTDGALDPNAPPLDLAPPVFTTAPGAVVGVGEAARVEGHAEPGAFVTFTGPSVTDNLDPHVVVVCAPGAGHFFPLGTSPVTCTATDAGGNATTGAFVVLVQDTVAPVLTVPAGLSAEGDSPAGATVTFAATAADGVDLAPTVICAPASGSVFPYGATTVTCTAQDDSGNISLPLSFIVTVSDTRAPTSVTVSVSPSILWPPNGVLVPVTVSGSASDAGSGVSTVEWRVIDEYGQHQPSGSIMVPGGGPFSFQVPLLADRRGNDKDGRHYRIEVVAVDRFGNRLVAAPLVVNVHDQSGS
jgi:hypothetical protein